MRPESIVTDSPAPVKIARFEFKVSARGVAHQIFFMKLISINVAEPKWIVSGRHEVETGIFKEPVSGPVKVRRLNLEGDRQADLSVHGGENKAVYAYSWQNIGHWKKVLKRNDLGPGSLGENLTVEGLLDTDVSIGDQLEIGTARFRVTQPRFP